jgi:glucose-1-phosphate thymidylyltransferase
VARLDTSLLFVAVYPDRGKHVPLRQMKGVVPAAGEGTRLRPRTANEPKGMVEVAGEPLLTHVFRTLREVGVEELVVIVGHEMDSIVAHYGERFEGLPITYVHQRERRGLAHAVLQAAPHVNGEFVVLNGDNVFADSIAPVIERAREPAVDGALLVETVPPEQARETGVVETDGEWVTDVIEKPDEPPTQLVTTGCHVLPETIFDACRLLRPSDRGEFELGDAVSVLARAGANVAAVPHDGERQNVNTPSDVERATEMLETP